MGSVHFLCEIKGHDPVNHDSFRCRYCNDVLEFFDEWNEWRPIEEEETFFDDSNYQKILVDGTTIVVKSDEDFFHIKVVNTDGTFNIDGTVSKDEAIGIKDGLGWILGLKYGND